MTCQRCGGRGLVETEVPITLSLPCPDCADRPEWNYDDDEVELPTCARCRGRRAVAEESTVRRAMKCPSCAGEYARLRFLGRLARADGGHDVHVAALRVRRSSSALDLARIQAEIDVARDAVIERLDEAFVLELIGRNLSDFGIALDAADLRAIAAILRSHPDACAVSLLED